MNFYAFIDNLHYSIALVMQKLPPCTTISLSLNLAFYGNAYGLLNNHILINFVPSILYFYIPDNLKK